MLNELQNIRSLLTTPGPESVRIATAELTKLSPALLDLPARVLAQPDITRDDLKALIELRSELSGILLLSHAAADYYDRLGRFLQVAFGEYERTGQLRVLETAHRTIAHL